MSDDPTKLVDQPATPPTQPTIETVLERIHALGESLKAEINEVRQGQEQLRTVIVEIKAQLKEIDSNVRLTNHKFDIVSKELLEVKAQARDAQTRVDELERKAS